MGCSQSRLRHKDGGNPLKDHTPLVKQTEPPLSCNPSSQQGCPVLIFISSGAPFACKMTNLRRCIAGWR